MDDGYVFFVVEILEKRGVYSSTAVTKPYMCQQDIQLFRGHPCVPRSLRSDIRMRNLCVKLSTGVKAICPCSSFLLVQTCANFHIVMLLAVLCVVLQKIQTDHSCFWQTDNGRGCIPSCMGFAILQLLCHAWVIHRRTRAAIRCVQHVPWLHKDSNLVSFCLFCYVRCIRHVSVHCIWYVSVRCIMHVSVRCTRYVLH